MGSYLRLICSLSFLYL